MNQGFRQLSPRDGFLLTKAQQLSDLDQRVLTSLYQPLMGPIAYTLCLSLWQSIRETPVDSKSMIMQTHAQVFNALNLDLPVFYENRLKLEALGLLRTYVDQQQDNRIFVYELYAPLQPNVFFQDDLLATLLFSTVGEQRFQELTSQFELHPVKRDLVEVTKKFLDVFKVDAAQLAHPASQIAESRQLVAEKEADKPAFSADELSSLDWAFYKELVSRNEITGQDVDSHRQALFNLHTFYNLPEIDLARLTAETMNVATGKIDIKALEQVALKQYSRASQPETTITETAKPQQTSEQNLTAQGFSREEIEVIQAAYQMLPSDYLKQLHNERGGFVGIGEAKILQQLQNRHVLSNPVINVLIHTVLSQNDSLNLNFVDAIANNWLHEKISTPEAAVQQLKKRQFDKNTRQTTTKVNQNKQQNQKKRANNARRTETLPQWAQPNFKPDLSKTTAEQYRKLREADARLKKSREEGRS